MKYKINDVFTLDEEYGERANFCNENCYCIEEIEPLKDGTRQFTIKELRQHTKEEIIKEIKNRVQQLLENTVKQKDYDSVESLTSYANSTIDSFKQDALSFIKWRDTLWLACYRYLDLYKAGEYEFTTVSDFLSLLPTFNWDTPSEVAE